MYTHMPIYLMIFFCPLHLCTSIWASTHLSLIPLILLCSLFLGTLKFIISCCFYSFKLSFGSFSSFFYCSLHFSDYNLLKYLILYSLLISTIEPSVFFFYYFPLNYEAYIIASLHVPILCILGFLYKK